MNIVITGASAGIGRAYVKTFARHGHTVFATARREHRLKDLSQEMAEKHGAVVHYLALDLTSEGAATTLFENAVQVFGKVHMLINNAGMSPYQEFIELHNFHLSQILSLNIKALTELCHIFIPHMLTHGEPSHVVNVGSVAGYAPQAVKPSAVPVKARERRSPSGCSSGSYRIMNAKTPLTSCPGRNRKGLKALPS